MPGHVGDRLLLRITNDSTGAPSAPFDRFVEMCRKRPGLRVARRADGLELSIDPLRIESLGPLVEAAATANGLQVWIGDLNAEVRSLGMDQRPSAVWAAIGDAADEDEVIRSRGDTPTGGLFRHLRIDETDGARVAVDARPPLVEPTESPIDLGPQKYDDAGWHVDSALEAGQPCEHAFTHIGIYMAWLIRHDLHDSQGLFSREHVRAVKAGEMTGSRLADDIDGKLLSEEMSAEGEAFSSARYNRYLSEYNDLLGEAAVYTVPEDDALYARVEAVIDRLYGEWIAAGRPGPEPRERSPIDEEFEAMFDVAAIPWDELGKVADGPISVELHRDGTYEVHSRRDMPHVDIDLEALVPIDLVEPPIAMHSVRAPEWSSSLLNRSLKQLGVRPRDVVVAIGIGGSGERTLAVTLYRVPGIPADRLREAFASAIYRPPGSEWQERVVGDVAVSWAEGRDGPLEFAVAYWTRDDLVLHVSGDRADMEGAILRLG